MAETTKQQPTAYILMPVRGTDEELLKNSINSIAKQDYGNIHLVIYDDGNTHEYIEKLVEILHEQKLGKIKCTIISNGSKPSETGNIAAARNQLLSYIKDYAEDSDFIFQLDSDDCFNGPNFISTAVKKMQEKQAKIGLLGFEYASDDKSFLERLLEQRKDLKKTKKETDEMVEKLSKQPFELDDFSKITTIGWTKFSRTI